MAMAGETSTAAAATAAGPSPSSILADDRIYICKAQFDEKSRELLIASAKALGAAFTDSVEQCTVILTNPAASTYDFDMTTFEAHAGAVEKCLPYHWLANCRIRDVRVALSALPTPIPLFTHPAPNKAHAPVKTWVSINVHKHTNEQPHAAQQNVADAMEANGSLIVPKRSQADVLIVDRLTKFYETIREEIRKRGRTDQIVAERNWVEDCVKRKKLSWKIDDSKAGTATQQAAERDSDQDSFVAEDSRPPGKGPGRPTGQQRVEYSAEDDDFLCRYLGFVGTESLKSRKTYQTMVCPLPIPATFADRQVSAADRYPWANRHSAQSWHERYKKNAVGFEGRVHRYRAAGIDETLKTAAERAKSAQIAREPPILATAEVDAEAEPGAGPEGERSKSAVAHPIRKTPGSGNKSRLDARSAPARPAAVLTVPEVEPVASASGTKNLVEPDSESDPVQTVPGAESVTTSAVPIPEADVIVEEKVIVESSLPARPPVGGADQSFDDRMAIDEVLGELEPQSQSQLQESGRLSNGGEASSGMAETQALLSDFTRAKAAAAARPKHTTPPPPADSPRRRPRTDDPTDLNLRSPARRNVPAPGSPTQRSPQRPSGALRPAAETFTLRSPPRAGGGHRTSMPALVHVELQAVEIGGNLIDIQPTGGVTGTSRRKSLLQRELDASADRRAARRSIGRPSSPDRVYASTRLPPSRPSPYPVPGDSSSPAPSTARARSPPISRVERAQRISQGAEVAEAYRHEYRANMLRLSRTYNLLPKELGRIMADFRQRGITGWLGVEEELAKMRREVEDGFRDDI